MMVQRRTLDFQGLAENTAASSSLYLWTVCQSVFFVVVPGICHDIHCKETHKNMGLGKE